MLRRRTPLGGCTILSSASASLTLIAHIFQISNIPMVYNQLKSVIIYIRTATLVAVRFSRVFI